MHQPKLRNVLEEKFSVEQVNEIVTLLERGFSPNGEIAVVTIFLYAADAGKKFDEIMRACQVEWERNWKYEHPRLKGDPDAPEVAGVQNRASLNNIYAILGIAPKSMQEVVKVSSKPLVVKTMNSTYQLGEADDTGQRSIAKDGGQLTFSQCRVAFLTKGKIMVVEPTDRPASEGSLATSIVEEIIEG